MGDFDARAFHEALDVKRQARGLTWAGLAAELNAPYSHRADIPPISPSTLSGMSKRGGLNGNIVMTALRWLGRSAEDFVLDGPAVDNVSIPDAGPGHLLRWNGPALYAQLDARRSELGLTWAGLAKQLGVGVSVLRGYANSSAAGFPWVMRATGWLERPAAAFMVEVQV